jgi:hypothetical protein
MLIIGQVVEVVEDGHKQLVTVVLAAAVVVDEESLQDLLELVEVLLYLLERMELLEHLVLLVVVQEELIQVVVEEVLVKEIIQDIVELVVMAVQELLLSDTGINNVKVSKQR